MNISERTPVWGLTIRVIHWALAATVLIALVTEEEALGLHSAAGYAMLGLIIMRLIFGLVGSTHARFLDFVRSPYAAWRYLEAAMRKKAFRYLGHNPAGGLMVLTLLVLLFATGISGIWY